MIDYVKPSAIIFDFDDTLVDSKPIITKALSATFAKFNINEDIIKIKNIDINRSLRDYFCDVFQDNIIEARDTYYEYYHNFSKDLVILENSERVLKILKENDVFTAIVSNKRGERLREEVHNKFLWSNYFNAIVGAGDAKKDKPSPDPAILALHNSGIVDYENVWFIGDSLVDLQTAKNLGCKAILFGSDVDVSSINLPIYFKVNNHLEFLDILKGVYA